MKESLFQIQRTMAGKYTRNKQNFFPEMLSQKKQIETDFDCFKCSIKGRGPNASLLCYGEITPTEFSQTYKIKLTYNGSGVPKVYVISPTIPFDDKAHMYSDGRLCLYYPPEDPWKHTKRISDTIIPWTAEWLVYYELYQIDGKWHGPFVQHGETKP